MKTSQAKELLQKNEVLIVNSGYTFEFLAVASLSNMVKIFDLKEKPKNNDITYVFSSLDQLNYYLPKQPHYFTSLLQILPSGQSFVLNTADSWFTSNQSTIALASTEEIKYLADELGPLIISSANIYQKPPATSYEMLLDYFPNKDLKILDSNLGYEMLGSEPSKSDCYSEKVIKIINPGIINWKQVEMFLKGVKIVYEYQEKEHQFKDLNILTVSSLKNIPDGAIILGSKESFLREGLDLPVFFHNHKYLGRTLINLGSESCPKTILKNLYKNLYQTSKSFNLNSKKIYWLQNSNHKNKKDFCWQAISHIQRQSSEKQIEDENSFMKYFNPFYLKRLLS